MYMGKEINYLVGFVKEDLDVGFFSFLVFIFIVSWYYLIIVVRFKI